MQLVFDTITDMLAQVVARSIYNKKGQKKANKR